jgi:mono/diheme cytochrome c family protein
MKMSSALFGLGLLVAGVLAVVRTSEGAPSAVPAPASSPLVGDAVAGNEQFTEHCSICHGVGAKGFIGPYIAGINWTVPGLHSIVRLGLGGYGSMPGFSADAVTEKNIADIVAYLAILPPASAPKSTRSQTTATAPAPPSATASTVAVGAPTPVSAASAAAQPNSSGTGDSAHGHQVYTTNCAACHGANAQGGIGPALRGEKARKDTAAAIAWIENPKPPMPKLYPSVLSEKDVDDVAAYVESL